MRHIVRTSIYHKRLQSPMLSPVISLRRSRHWFARHYIYYGVSFDEQLFRKLVRQDALMNSYEPNFKRFLLSNYSYLMENFYIPKYFTFSELTVTTLRIPNYPRDFRQISNLCNLCKTILDPLRDLIDAPIIVNSAFRSPKVNLAVGGSANSFHLDGCAADIRSTFYSPDYLFEILRDNFPYTELIKYSNFVHIAYNPNSSKHYIGTHV